MLKGIVYKVLERIVKKLLVIGLFDSIILKSNEPSKTKRNKNIFTGKNVAIDPTASLVLFGEGKIFFEGNNYVGRNAEIGTKGRVTVGCRSSIQDRCIILGEVDIGRSCLLAPNVFMSSNVHTYGYEPGLYIKDQDELVKSSGDYKNAKVIVEDDVWIGMNAVIMEGITLGKGSVIGANSVVTKDVFPYTIVGGVPAKLLKKRLNYEPKGTIDCFERLDMPYFYQGVHTQLSDINQVGARGGLTVDSAFVISLKSNDFISVLFKSDADFEILITYHNQTKVIAANCKVTIEFNCDKVDLHKFTVQGSRSENLKIISAQTYISSLKNAIS